MTLRDLPAVARIFEKRAGARPPAGWRDHLRALIANPAAGVALVATAAGAKESIGYVAGEVRSWEFGSEPAGWIFALAVDGDWQRHGAGRALLEGAVKRLRETGVRTVRTMVSRDDVAVLRFFRREQFVAGPYTELELELTGVRP